MPAPLGCSHDDDPRAQRTEPRPTRHPRARGLRQRDPRRPRRRRSRRRCPTASTIDLRQTDDEAELIGWLHEAVDRRLPVILNPAAFTHYSYALRDAAALVTQAGLPLVEVHLSNPHTRENFRHTSVISGVATGVIAGFGCDSYRLAVDSRFCDRARSSV